MDYPSGKNGDGVATIILRLMIPGSDKPHQAVAGDGDVLYHIRLLGRRFTDGVYYSIDPDYHEEWEVELLEGHAMNKPEANQPHRHRAVRMTAPDAENEYTEICSCGYTSTVKLRKNGMDKGPWLASSEPTRGDHKWRPRDER